MVVVTVLARDNDKPGNKELIGFLKPNFQALLSAGLVFSLKIVEDSDIPDLVKKGLDKLPVAIIQNKNYASSVEIKNVLMKYLAASSSSNRKVQREPEDELREFYRDEMSFDAAERDNEMDNEGDGKRDLMSKYQQEVQRRQEEDSKRGPKPAQRGRKPPSRRDNVDEELQPPVRSARPANRPEQRDPRISGGDPKNKDDALLDAMFETSD